MQLIRMLIVAVALALHAGAGAAERSILQYTHQRWSRELDAPQPVVALAQDGTGFLWVASAAGLFRFDGMRFVPMSSHIDLVRHGMPSAFLVRRNGEIWTSFERSGRFAVFRDGWLRLLRVPPAPGRVMAMHETRDGTIWILTEEIGTPLLRFRDGQWTTFGTEAGAPLDNAFSMVVTREGVVWVSFTGSVAKLAPDGRRFEVVRTDPGSLGRLSIDPQERIWLTERRGTYPLTGLGGHGSPPPLRHAYATDIAEIRGRPAFDRDGNLWIATYYDGLQRVAHPDPRGAASAAEAAARVEHFTERDGLSSNATSQMLQDAEGNVWAATERGIDRFRPATIRFEPALADPAAFGDLLLAASDGTVYVGEASAVYRIRPGGNPEPILRPQAEPRSLCEAPDGSIWIGVGKDVLAWRDGHVRRITRVPLAATIYDCAFDGQGGYWVTAARGGMARYAHGRWESIPAPADTPFLPTTMTTDDRGRIVVHWNEHLLSRIEGAQRQSAAIPFGDYLPNAVTLYRDQADIFVAGRFGLARLRDDRFASLSARRFRLLSGVNGMVRTPQGEVWLASPAGILRTTAAGLARAFSDPRGTLSMQRFGLADGLRNLPHTHSRKSMVRGGDGRIWISTQTGTLWLDPGDIRRSRTAPATIINSLVAADTLFVEPENITLPAGTTRLTIDFSVLSFANPSAALARYRLEGLDTDWVEAGPRRQAIYNNLVPGTYRFRLIAANEDGVWNDRGSTLMVVIPPTFLQSRWFDALCLLAIVLLLWLAYRVRLARVAATIRTRLEERLGERERIARELHDTLLQSVQGLVLKFQSVANRMPDEADSRRRLEEALKRADEVIAEGRNRVQDLRVAAGSSDLASLIEERAAEAGLDPGTSVRIIVEGRPRPVHPLISIELGRIADEALFNVAVHAAATAVVIAIRFGARELGLEVRDNGIGIPGDVLLRGGKPGHFGLTGMRERAERIGGTFSVESGPSIGCAVTVTVPGRLAFADYVPRRRLLPDLSRWRRESSHG